MKDKLLDAEEESILEAFEAGEFQSMLDEDRKIQLEAAAEQTFKKDKRINIRLSKRDLDALKRLALREGVPYQTLVSSVLHKYAEGKLKATDD